MTLTEAKRSLTGEVVAALKQAGLCSAIRSRRMDRSGFKVATWQAKGCWASVEWIVAGSDAYDREARTDAMEITLKSAGFRVDRPFPDRTILGVRRQPKAIV